MASSIISSRRKFMQGACATTALVVVPTNQASARERVENCYQQLRDAMNDLAQEYDANAWHFTLSSVLEDATAEKQDTQKFTFWGDEEKYVKERGKSYRVPVEIAEYQRHSLVEHEFGSKSLALI